MRRLYRQWEDDPGVQWGECEHAKLRIRVPSPCAKPDGDLLLDLHGGEFIVFFTAFHTHLDFDPEEPLFAVDVATLCRFIDSMLDERLAIVNLYSGDQWAGSRAVTLNPAVGLTPRARLDIQDFALRQRATRICVRSWLGTFDSEEAFDATP